MAGKEVDIRTSAASERPTTTLKQARVADYDGGIIITPAGQPAAPER